MLRRIINYAVMSNIRDKDTLDSFHSDFGQLFDNFDQFKLHFFNVTKEKFTGMLYDSSIDNKDDNYLSIKAPDVSKLDIKLKY